jgi:hypothetical protein
MAAVFSHDQAISRCVIFHKVDKRETKIKVEIIVKVRVNNKKILSKMQILAKPVGLLTKELEISVGTDCSCRELKIGWLA